MNLQTKRKKKQKNSIPHSPIEIAKQEAEVEDDLLNNPKHKKKP